MKILIQIPQFNEDEMQVARLESQLQAKTNDLEVLQKELEDCQSQVEVMKTTVVKSKQEQDKLQSANTKVQFELAEQQRLAAELGREVEAATAKLEEERDELVLKWLRMIQGEVFKRIKSVTWGKRRDQRELLVVCQRNFRKYMALRDWG